MNKIKKTLAKFIWRFKKDTEPTMFQKRLLYFIAGDAIIITRKEK